MNRNQAYQLIQKYFPKDQWENAYKVMLGESGGRSDAVGDNFPIRGQVIPSYGLFQIRALPGRPAPEQLLDPDFNVRYAAQLFKQQGWGPWTAARKLGLVQGVHTKAIPTPTVKQVPAQPQKPPQEAVNLLLEQEKEASLGERIKRLFSRSQVRVPTPSAMGRAAAYPSSRYDSILTPQTRPAVYSEFSQRPIYEQVGGYETMGRKLPPYVV